MEVDENLIDTEADINAYLRQRPQGKKGEDVHRGEHLAIASGGIPYDKHATEEDRLLGDSEDEGANDATHGGADGSQWPGFKDFEHLPAWRRPSVFWLLPPFFLFTLAYGGIIVPKVNLIIELICRDYYAEQANLDPNFHYLPILFGQPNEQCNATGVQKRVTLFALAGNLISGTLAAITSPKIGALSDRYGRTRMLIITSGGALTAEILTIVAGTHPETFPVGWLYVGFVLDGLCGSFTAAMALAGCYATDCTPPGKRNAAFGYFHGCLFTGIAVGPIIAGAIVRASGSLVIPFWLALGAHIIFVSFLAFVIPESLSKRRQHEARKLRSQEMSKWRLTKGTWSHSRTLNQHLRAAQGPLARRARHLGGTAPQHDPPREHRHDNSAFTSAVNASRVLVLFVLLPSLIRIFRGPLSPDALKRPHRQRGCDAVDLGLIRVAIIFDTIGFAGYALVRSGPLFILSGVSGEYWGNGLAVDAVGADQARPPPTGPARYWARVDCCMRSRASWRRRCST
ncbi:hypothetical protein MRB53_037911 [Persea americana]|nr:hypothetical protein MRB53_037911 [Persea americana]